MKSLHRLPDGTFERRYRKHIFGGGTPPPPAPLELPPTAAPQQLPQTKPQRRGMQQSFLSGAAMAQQSAAAGQGTSTGGGKSLLGQ